MDEKDLGIRIRSLRLRRGMTQRVLAELAGFSQGYIAQIELGIARPDRRATLRSIANALQVSVRELDEQLGSDAIYRPVKSDMTIERLRSALLCICAPELGTSDPDGLFAPRPNLSVISTYFHACRYDLLLPILADALEASAVDRPHASTADREARLRDLVMLCHRVASVCMYLQHSDLAVLAAHQGRQAADALGEPGPRGVANWALIAVIGDQPGRQNLIHQGLHQLERHVSADLLAAEAYGMHQLSASHAAAARGSRAAALDHLAEARRTARHTGERHLHPFAFGPTNVMIWRLSISVALGEGMRTLDASPEPLVGKILSSNREAYYHMHRASALLQSRQRDADALADLQTAERTAPQLVRTSREAEAAVRVILRRSRVRALPGLASISERVRLRD
jgi:transcriptional regulator with XRE-family HTH domain